MRHKLRSGVVITSIILGMWSAIMVMGLSFGVSSQRLQNAVDTYVSHIQIHHPEYSQNQRIADSLDYYTIKSLNLPQGAHSAARSKITGMIASPKQAQGVVLYGIQPEEEKTVTNIHTQIDTGSYFSGAYKNPILIGRKLANKLDVRVRNKVVITFQDADNELISGAFRVVGIYKTTNSGFDEMHAFIPQTSIKRLLGSAPIHEVAITLPDIAQAQPVAEALQQQLPGTLVEYWAQISPELGYADDMMEQMLFIFIGIIILALLFGIINTMLMAVLERKKELGMLQAIGMNKQRIFFMVMLETLYFSLVGGPTGLLLGYLSIRYFNATGIDVSSVGQGMEAFGMAAVLRPELDLSYYPVIFTGIMLASLLAAVYPARKALSLNPSESIRSL
jgi:ABC-type lipoprotein release transport system permease subunit